MIDIIASLSLAALYATIVGALVALAPIGGPARLRVLAGAGIWGAFVVAVAAAGGFGPGVLEPVPAVVLPFAAFLGAGLLAWWRMPRVRAALEAIPLPVLIGLNAGRFLGAFFVILYIDGRLPAPFAPSAGWGDVTVAAFAAPLAIAAARGTARVAWLKLWNALGTLDLVVAVSLGVLSAPGTPWQMFGMRGITTAAMGDLPWIIIPALLVPLYLLIHVAIGARLGAAMPTHTAAAPA
jgi:hypothetical protein